MSDKQVKSEQTENEDVAMEKAEEFKEKHLIGQWPKNAEFGKLCYADGYKDAMADANALTEDARGASELMRLVSRTNNGDEVEFEIKGDTVFFKDLYGEKPIANLVKKRSGNYFVEGMTTDGTEFRGDQPSKREAVLWAIDQWILYTYG